MQLTVLQSEDQIIISKILVEWERFKNSTVGQSNLVAIASQRVKNFLERDELEEIAKRFLTFLKSTQIDPDRFFYSESHFSVVLKTEFPVEEALLIPFDFIRLFIAAKKEAQIFLKQLKSENITLDEFIFRTKRFLLDQRIHLTKNDIALLKVCVEPEKIVPSPGKFTQNAQEIKKHMKCSLATVYNSLNKLRTLGILKNKLHINYPKFNLHPYLLASNEPIKVRKPLLQAGTITQRTQFSIILVNNDYKISGEVSASPITFFHERWNFHRYRNRKDPLFPIYPKKVKKTKDLDTGVKITTDPSQESIKFDTRDLQIIDYLNTNHEVRSISQLLALSEKEVLKRIFDLYSQKFIFLYPSISMIGLPVRAYYYVRGSKESLLQFRTFLEEFIHYCFFGGADFIFGISQIPMSWVHQLYDVFGLEAPNYEDVSFGILTEEQQRNGLQLTALWDKENQHWKNPF